MTSALTERNAPAPPALGVIDVDIHPSMRSPATLYPYLPSRWREHAQVYGTRIQHSFATGPSYKSPNNGGMRADAEPAAGGPPGSDLETLREQLLVPFDVRLGLLNALDSVATQLNHEYGAALASAVNDWQLNEIVALEPRLRLSMAVTYEDAAAAVQEIDRIGGRSEVAAILFLSRTLEPLGHRRYWPIYRAAEEHDLPIAIHLNETGGHRNTGSGWPGYYFDYHTGQTQVFQNQVVSLLCDGVFEVFPRLRMVLLEGGVAWAPSLMWRLDAHWARLKSEVPRLTRRPSEYLREHIWFATQPMEEPDDPRHLIEIFEEIGHDQIVFSSDYPHWDFDSPARSLPPGLSTSVRRGILHDNARALFRDAWPDA
jgi:predicted TIM-barrel fold metal-dependent hydrolase